MQEPHFHSRWWMLFIEGFYRFPGHRADGGHARFFDLSATGDSAFVSPSHVGLLRLQCDRDTVVRFFQPFTSDAQLEFELTVAFR
jgi:hypothetical protein